MMKRTLFLLLLTTLSFNQEAPFGNFVIGFWPEYDHPGVLVTIQVDIAEKDLPYDISLELPSGSKMALQKSTDDTRDTSDIQMVPQEIRITDGKSIMPIHLTNIRYYAQFYFNPFDKSDLRTMDYNFKADKDLGHFYVVIQKHYLAENFTTNLTDPKLLQNDFNLTFYQQHYEHLDAGEELNIRFSYNNPTHQTTVEALEKNMDDHPEMSQNTADEQNSVKPSQFKNVKLYTIPLFVLMLVILGWIIKANSKSQSGNKPLKAGSNSNRFCTECGTILNSNDRFCTKCGKKQHVS